MGGNAFKVTRRYDSIEYFNLEREVLTKINDKFGYEYIRARALQAYKTKESFGDMDIVICSDWLPGNWKEIFIELFDVEKDQWYLNGDVFSFVYKDFQIDIIKTPFMYYWSTLEYFAYNDLGNLLGRMTHKMGLKLGHKGLSLIVRDEENNHILEEIELENSIYPALEILGLDDDKYSNGFDTLEDIFKFVASSPYFNPEIYLLENRSHASKVRDRKRKTYSAFLEWCEANKDSLNKFDWGNISEKGGYNIREPWYTDIICKEWPYLKEHVDQVIADHNLHLEYKKCINGEMAMEITGLQGKELGEFMKYAKQKIEYAYNPEFIVAQGPEFSKVIIMGIWAFKLKGWEWPVIPAEEAAKYYGRIRKC